ncbi:hypothetical protein [Brevundimonas nasdae]|uniref:hypothetical protein n=1 Tax=Brevundimonas nasdae TaxID=172043 RepID=UPI003F68EDC8
MRAALIIGAALLLFGCGRTAKPEYASYGLAALDCKKGFEALVAELDAARNLIVWRHEKGLNEYRDDSDLSLYLVTLPDHPAHPAIFLRRVNVAIDSFGIDSSGCGFGDKEAFEREKTAYQLFDRMLTEEHPCYWCDGSKPASPSVWRHITPPPPPPPDDTDSPA